MWAAWCKGQLHWNGWQLTYLSDGLWGCSERKAKSQHGMDWFIRRMILLIMVDHDQCSPYTDSPYGLLRWWRSLLTAGTLELLPKRPKAKRSLLQYVLRKDCRKVMRCVLCCSYCAWIQSHGRYGRLSVQWCTSGGDKSSKEVEIWR